MRVAVAELLDGSEMDGDLQTGSWPQSVVD